MHLLASKPGGFVDDEGIIDLQQTPADIVILSAADSSLASLALAVDELSESFPSVRLANWLQLTKPAALDLYRNAVLDQAQVIVLSLLGGRSYWEYGLEQLQDWFAQNKNRQLIVVPGDDTPDPSLLSISSVPMEEAHRVWRYFREGGVDNSAQLLSFLAQRFFDIDISWHEPKRLPGALLYMPMYMPNQTDVVTLADWQNRWRQKSHPVVIVLFYRSHIQSANTSMFDDLLASLSREGLNPLPIAVTSLKNAECIATVNELIEAADASLVLNTTGFASNTVGSPDLSSEPTYFQSQFVRSLPVLQLILSSSTEEDWQTASQGLRSRDIAMQVVLPEMDGRIVTRAISFKESNDYCERAQISVVRYGLHHERATFVAQLAKRYCTLASKSNAEKKIAIILANYPTKDGRIGNGVGLDTPDSTLQILTALQAEDYPVANVPENGNQLIEALLESITNNPNTLHQLPCWQSMSMDDYLYCFQQLPETCQNAVWRRWGSPQQDPKCRQDRLMIAGIRLGETFVGIQPARGFNLDLVANYHDPDLVPPHAYLAFYFWLRHTYQVDAIIHVGKHGNLEWLPGKGTALSSTCWPDVALGPTPHFYPFIVNDPGEGAQAKRRAQAAIIDHLMPPMARAETYGALAELEGYVDEYYQAMGLDPHREKWLKEKILQQVTETHVVQELGNVDTENEEAILSELDAYLCDIKEAQIRHGLHRLGKLPEQQKLAETLVALVRLPRGEQGSNQGILHALCRDLDLSFDPLASSNEVWQGDKPACLQRVSNDVWRTTADTRERLEELSLLLMQETFLDDSEHSEKALTAILPEACTQARQVLLYVKDTLLPALQQSVYMEIQSLLVGLNGKWIPPGPSGAPTRGRLDTLPTGRNFFSVDNRSIPTPAAWALGQRSAQALIERHLQEHGDYPRQLGLSVWGTATMRTGGDDIAQAFALMGIKPVWARGSNRVVDFEMESGMLLGRPRVDVTLRVSGFFRDAFPNVMKLYDAAVVALSELEEPGEGNTIRDTVQKRQRELMAAGQSDEDAFREASYRVFGSKPGAYGAGLQGLIDERCWEDNRDLADAYLNWGGYAYGRQSDGVEARQSFQHRLSQIDVVVHNQDNREHDLLDSDDYYQFQGGMTNAVSVFGNKPPEIYHSDHSNPASPKIRTLKEELNRVIRSRVLNPKWITAMREHGYKGAFEMAASVDYLFAYDATTNLIDDYQYEAVTESLVLDAVNQQFLQENNPQALEEMAERLLEATQRGLWQAPGEYKVALQNLLLDLDEQQERPD